MAADLTVRIIARLGTTEVHIGTLTIPADYPSTPVSVDTRDELLRLAATVMRATAEGSPV